MRGCPNGMVAIGVIDQRYLLTEKGVGIGCNFSPSLLCKCLFHFMGIGLDDLSWALPIPDIL